MAKTIIALAAAACLSGCAASGSASAPTYQQNIAALQSSVGAIEAALAVYPATSTPGFLKAETTLNTLLATLAAQPTLSNAQQVLTAFQAIDTALPANVLSPAHQAEIAAGLALARLVVSGLPSS